MQECLIWVALDEIVHKAEVVEVDRSLLSRAELTCENQDEIKIEANVEHAPLSPIEWSDGIKTRFARLERSVEIILRSKLLILCMRSEGAAEHWWKPARPILSVKHPELTWEMFMDVFRWQNYPGHYLKEIMDKSQYSDPEDLIYWRVWRLSYILWQILPRHYEQVTVEMSKGLWKGSDCQFESDWPWDTTYTEAVHRFTVG